MDRLRQLVSMDNSQFGLVPGKDMTDEILVAEAARVSSCQQEPLHGFC